MQSALPATGPVCGAGIVTGGAFRASSAVMGICFNGYGSAGVMAPVYGKRFLAAGFGGLHICLEHSSRGGWWLKLQPNSESQHAWDPSAAGLLDSTGMPELDR